MDHVDEQTRHKIREWQMRRLEIKDLMATHPERVLELSQVLDQMEEEHERILAQAEVVASDEPSVTPGGFDLQLRVSAHNAQHLRKLLEMALYELDGVIEADREGAQGEGRAYPGGMSGSLGTYEYALQVTARSEPCAVE